MQCYIVDPTSGLIAAEFASKECYEYLEKTVDTAWTDDLGWVVIWNLGKRYGGPTACWHKIPPNPSIRSRNL